MALERCFCIGAAGFPGACGRQEVAVLHLRLFTTGREDAGAAVPGHGRRGDYRGVRCRGGCGMRCWWIGWSSTGGLWGSRHIAG